MKYSKEFKKEISDLFLSGISVEKISKLYNIPHAKTIYRFLHEFNINTPHRKLSLDEKFFENIDSEEKAYWLGFLSADGYISNTDDIWLGLSRKDYFHLEKFKKSLNSGHKIGTRDVFDKRTQKIHKKAYISFYSKKMNSDLKLLGFTNNKSFDLKAIDFQLEQNLKRHYWRGLVDGDGSIYKTNGRYGTCLVGTLDICNSYLSFIKDKLSIENGHIYERENYFICNFNGNLNTLKITELLYDNSLMFLDRKKEIADKIKIEDISFETHIRYPKNLKEELLLKLSSGISASVLSKQYGINRSTLNVWKYDLKHKQMDINFI